MGNNFKDIETEPEEQLSESKITHSGKTRKSFAKLALELSEEELATSGVQKMLLAEILRLERELLKTSTFQEKYHSADKDRAILNEKQKKSIFSEILYSVTLTLGAVLIGLTPSINYPNFNSLIVLGIGVVLIIGALIAKVTKK